MQTVNMHEAKTHLSRLVERVQKGERLIIGKAGKPVAVLSPYEEENKVRRPGSMKGKIRIGKDFAKADEEIEELFTGANE